MLRHLRLVLRFAALVAVFELLLVPGSAGQTTSAPVVVSTRLYIFDCGVIRDMNVATWGYTPGEVALPHAAIPCHLVVHPKGTLIWDTGVVPDHLIGSGTPGSNRATNPLRAQLAAIGYSPADVTYLALSHYHIDHAGNANMFAGSTWLVRRAERDAMFAEPPPPVADSSHYNLLRNSKTIILEQDEYDVFGDGAVVIKAAVGHTPGHQVLVLNLAKTGRVVLGGDLYHFPEQRHTDRTPTFEFNREQSLAARVAIEAYVKRTGAQFWIEHDFAANAKLRKSPEFYE